MDIHPYIDNDHPSPLRHPLTGQAPYLWFPISPALAAAAAPDMRIVYLHPALSQPLSRASRPSARARALNGGAPQRANARTSRVICVTAAPTPSYVGRRSSYTLPRRCTAGVNSGSDLPREAHHTTGTVLGDENFHQHGRTVAG
jgi:hypothetical protein